MAHALAAIDRYNSRLGPQFAAAVTYFTILSLIPILMFAFGALGITLTVLRPDLLDQITVYVMDLLGDEVMGEEITSAIETALSNWRVVVSVALVVVVYSGPNWVGNLKRAVRVMWAENFEDATVRKNFLLELITNLGIFLGLLLTLGIGVAIAQIGHGLSEQLIGWFGWETIPGISLVWRLVTFGLTFLVSWILMAFLFTVLPRRAVRPKAWLIGTLMGAILVTVLQSLGGLLTGLLGEIQGAQFFGPIIVLMLLFNTLATMILLTAAWVGTEDVWRADRAAKLAAEKAARANDLDLNEDGADLALARQASRRWADTHDLDDLSGATAVLPEIRSDRHVRQDVAARGMRANLRIGYGFGTATGLGLGALLVGIFRLIFRR